MRLPLAAPLATLLFACGPGYPVGPEGDVYAACVEQYRLACECENPMVAGNGADDPEWACGLSDEDIAGLCSYADASVCDAQGDAFDADACEGYHESFPDDVADFFVCYTREVADCDVDAAIEAC